MKLLLIFISFNTFAGFNDLPMDSYHYDIKEKKTKKIEKKKPRKRKSTNKVNSLLDEINKNDQLINSFLKNSEKRVIVRKKDSKVKTLTRLKGTLLNSVLATNRRQTTLVIKLDETEYFEEAEVRCLGSSYGKRIIGNCNLIVSNKEYKVEAELWDMDGAEGIIADKFYDGSEKAFLTSSFNAFFQGVMDTTKDRALTSQGEVELTNAKNKVLSGVIGINRNIGKMVKNSAEANLQISLINSGKRVYVFFQKGVTL